jgi:hypothetical protein
MTSRRLVAVSAIALLGVGVLAGCSSSGSSSSSSSASTAASTAASAAASTAASAAASAGASAGATAGLPAPIIITEGQNTATAKVGDFIDIVVKQPAGTTIDTDKPNLLEVTQAHQDGTAIFNPGAKALAAGTATIIVTNPNGTTRNIVVTITDK